MKKILISLVAAALLLGALMPISGAYSRVKSYYSGDVTFYDGHIIIATTSMGSLEVFKQWPGGDVVKFSAIRNFDKRFGVNKDFNDALLRIENDALFVYVVDNYTIYKYDISDLKQARRVAEATNTSWDWYGSLNVINGRVATVGSNGVNLWSNDLKVIDSYKITNPGNYAYNVTPAHSDKYIFSIADSKIAIYDRNTRSKKTDIPLTFKWGSDRYNREIYNDRNDDSVYVVDDEAVKKINFNGEIEKSFDHTGPLGYDVVPSLDGNYIYFTDGIGIVKLRKSDLSVAAYTYTTPLASGNGVSWAMGVKTVWDGEGEKVVVFNGSDILVLDSNLKLTKADTTKHAFVMAVEEDDYPTVTEQLALAIDKNHSPANSQVTLSGQGFGQGEALTISFVGTNHSFSAQADQFGRFNQTITVPNLSTQRIDIKVTGLSSNLSYNLGFLID